MVSIVNSPPLVGGCDDVGLPNAFTLGESSMPLTDADLLVGGEVPRPGDDTGDLIGDGDLLTPDDNELSPAT
jgi:hypothetical protein